MKLIISVLFLLMVAFGFAQKATTANFDKAKKSFHSQEYKKTIEHCNLVLISDSLFVEAYIYRGVSNHLLTENKEALLDLNKAIEIDPKNAKAYRNRAAVKHEIKNYE